MAGDVRTRDSRTGRCGDETGLSVPRRRGRVARGGRIVASAVAVAALALVAASGSTAAQDAVVGPGDAIQDAVDDAGPDDVIAVEDGDYNQSVTVTRSRNLTIRAADGATPVLDGTAQPRGTTLVELAPQNDTAIQGLRIEGLRFLNIPSHAGGNYQSGHGIAMFTTGVANDVAIVDNAFDNTDIPPPSDHEGAGIVLDNVDGLVVADNTFRGVARDGSPIGWGTTLDQKSAINVHDYGDANVLRDVLISGNTIVNVTRGMWIGGGSGTNTALDNVTVADNRIEDVLREGIRAEVAAPSGSGRLVAERNVLVGADAGFRVNNGAVVVRDLLVAGQAPDYGVAAGDHYGIGLEDGGDVTVRGADVADQAADGVKVLNGNLTLLRSTVSGNAGDDLDVRGPTLTMDRVDVGSAMLSGTASQVTVEEADGHPAYPDGSAGVGNVLNASNRTADGYLDATLSYTPGDAWNLNESTIGIHRYDTGAGGWTAVSSTLDVTADTVSANLTTFSTVAAFGDERVSGDADEEDGTADGDGSETVEEPGNEGETEDAETSAQDDGAAEAGDEGTSGDASGDDGAVTDVGGEEPETTVGGTGNDTEEVREPDAGPGVLERFWPLFLLLLVALIVAARYATREDEEE